MKNCDAKRISKTLLSVGLIFDRFSIFSIATSLIVQPQYSSVLNVYSERYCRNGNCLGLMFYYEAVDINVTMTGNYTILCNSTMDTYGYIYSNSFNPSFRSRNLLLSDNESGGNNQFMFTVLLQSLAKYILIVTTFAEEVTGTFSIIATGSGLLSFSPRSMSNKNSSYFKNASQIKRGNHSKKNMFRC